MAGRTIIEIESSSDDDDDNDPSDLLSNPAVRSFNASGDGLPTTAYASSTDPEAHYQSCLESVTECFPDVSHDYVQSLYSKQFHSFKLGEVSTLAQTLISQILDRGPYPKEKDRLKAINELKRKRGKSNDELQEATKWKNSDSRSDPEVYAKVS